MNLIFFDKEKILRIFLGRKMMIKKKIFFIRGKIKSFLYEEKGDVKFITLITDKYKQ